MSDRGKDPMLKTVLTGLAFLVLGVFAYVGYNSYAVAKHPLPDEVYAGADTRPASQAAAPADVTGNPELTAQGSRTANGAPPPASDTIAPNPPNGMTFGGSGHYQLYRQGDLTWRLNTDNGETCVIFATDEEWHKPKVFKSGCRGK